MHPSGTATTCNNSIGSVSFRLRIEAVIAHELTHAVVLGHEERETANACPSADQACKAAARSVLARDARRLAEEIENLYISLGQASPPDPKLLRSEME